MLRRLLACLALLTGLLAGAVPVSAAVAVAQAAQLEAAAKDDAGSPTLAANCNERGRQQQTRGEKPAPCKSSRTVTIVIPTVQMGADRAFE